MRAEFTKKIEKTQLFLVLGTKNYLNALKNNDEDILQQIEIATRLNKPFFIVIDSSLSKEEIESIRKYFSKNDIIKEMIVDFTNPLSMDELVYEIKKLSKESTGDDNIKIITPY